MFRFFQHKTKDIITVFHKPSLPGSMRVASLLKQVNANATEAATEDQASDHSHQTHPKRQEFELNITEDAPTADQLQTILGYVGPAQVGSVVKGAHNVQEALKKFKESPDSFKHPVVVDWNNGRAVASENESEILKMLNELKKGE